MSGVRCFLLEPTDRVQVSLRRYEGSVCPLPHGYHNAENVIGEDAVRRTADGGYWGEGEMVDHADARWPTHCGCGYEFKPEDRWQVNHTLLYRRQDTGEQMTLHDAPAGAFWWADWLARNQGSVHHQQRGGGPHLMLKCPTGDWDLDAKSANGDGWTRQGEPPNVTAHPSIGIHGKDGGFSYHGWLRNGVLVEC